MRRILTSLPYERRIGLQGAADRLLIGDSVRRTLLMPVADTHLDDTLERASGKPVRCDVSGSLLADRTSHGYGEQWEFRYDITVNEGVVPVFMFSGYNHLEFYHEFATFVTAAYICDVSGNYLQELPIYQMTRAKGVRWKCYLILAGQVGAGTTIIGYHYR